MKITGTAGGDYQKYNSNNYISGIQREEKKAKGYICGLEDTNGNWITYTKTDKTLTIVLGISREIFEVIERDIIDDIDNLFCKYGGIIAHACSAEDDFWQNNMDPKLYSVYGKSLAGDLRQYAHGRQLLRKAGLNLAESTSGKRKGQIILSKRGDAALRKYLYLATIQLVGNNPVFQKLNENNVQVKHMKKQQSIFKLLGKLARIIISIIHKGETFSPEIAAPAFMQVA